MREVKLSRDSSRKLPTHLSHDENNAPETISRTFLSRLASLLLLTLVFLYASNHFVRPCIEHHTLPGAPLSASPDNLDDVLQGVTLIDGHNDWAIWMRVFHGNSLENVTKDSEIDGQVDLPRLQEGKLGGQFWSVYVECPTPERDSMSSEEDSFPNSLYWERVHDTLQQIDFMHRVFQKFPDQFEQALTAHDVRTIRSRSPSKIASFLGIEGLHQIGNSPSILRQYYRLGVRYATLTHDCHNRFADAAWPATGIHDGLSQAGKKMIKEMNRIGMAIDLAHVSAKTMRDVLTLSRAPVLFSHSSAYGLCPHRRNVPDDVLEMVQKNNGLVMVTFYPQYTRCEDPDRADLADVADHIEYIGRKIGYQHVGIGADFDGMARGVLGLEDVSKYPMLVSELLQRGVPKSEVQGICGLNVLRVLEGVERLKAEMIDEGPLEDGDWL